MSGSGVKVMVVPVPRAAPARFILPAGLPRRKLCSHSAPSRLTRATSDSASALTTDAPTPCRPPEWA
jgi:hypothetical protein